MTSVYARSTVVPVERSKAEIETTLKRFGARAFMYGVDETRAVIGFTMRERNIRFYLPLPTRADVNRNPDSGRIRTRTQIDAALIQETKRRWRSLLLMIKAKLEGIDSGIVTFEDEFAMHMVLPDGRTAGEIVIPAIDQGYALGTVPPLLGITPGKE